MPSHNARPDDGARQRAIIESATDIAIIATDRDGIVTDWNSGAEAIFGWTAAEMIGEPTTRFFTPEDRTIGRVETEMQLALANGRANDERWHVCADGSRFWALGELVPLRAEGAHLGFVKILRDATADHRHRLELEAAAARLQRAQEAGGVGVFSVDMDGVLHPTPNFCRLYGLPVRETMPAELFERRVVAEDSGLVSTASSRRDGGARMDVEYRIRRADTGELRWIARKGEFEYDANGRPLRFVGVARDITDQVIARQQLAAEREQFAQLFEQAPTFMAMLRGAEHRFERVNPGYVRLVGRDVVGKTVDEALPEAVSQGYVALLDEVFRTGQSFEASGEKFTVQAGPHGEMVDRFVDFVYQPIRDPDGVVSGIFVEGADVTERTLARDALAESESRYRTLFEAIDTGFCIVEMRFDDADPERAIDYRIIECNEAFARMTGLHDAQGRWVSDLAPGLERKWFDIYGAVARTGTAARFENQAEAFGRWYDVQALRIADRATHRVAILFNDITERKAVEARQAVLIELGDTLRDLHDPGAIAFAASGVLARALGNSRVGYGIIDPLTETIHIERDWNAPGVKSLAGILNLRDYGCYIEDLKHGETVVIADASQDARTRDSADALAAIDATAFVNVPLVEQGGFVALLYATQAGPRMWSEQDLLLMREVAERIRAATERVRADIASRESEEQFRVFAQAVPNQIWASRPDGYLYWFNDQVYGYTGRAPGALDGNSGWNDIVHPDDLPDAGRSWLAALSAGTIYDAEFRIRRADGAYRWFVVRAEPVRGADGGIARWVGTNTDIDDRRQQALALHRMNETLEEQVAERTRDLMMAEEALRQSQKMEAVGQLTGGIAHDFNNLLTGITGSLELLGIRVAQGRIGEVDRYVAAAQGAAKRAAALTHRLLAFSRRQTLDPRPTDVNRLIAGMEDLVRRTVGPEVEVEVVAAGGLWPTLVDPNQLENALLNLCINARDAMPGGGRLTVETGNRWLDARAARERELDPGQYVSLSVSDTGTGMTPEVIAKAFDPFFTTKPLGLGTGLGLSMIYGFARQSGGQVRIYSEVGNGTLVCIYLPRHIGPAEEVELPGEQGAAPRAVDGETVLVVDDEPTVRMLVVEVLEELGYAAIEAADGASGLKLLQSDARIDLLVTDVGLPGGMNGRQMADAARVDRPDLSILFITGYAENAVIGNGLLDRDMHVMTKPFAMDALAARIKELIAQP
jgi:PAS domain S-box-containing protein